MDKTETGAANLNGIHVLKQMRDELSLQANLFSMEMKEEWARLERQWNDLQADLVPAKKSLDHAIEARRKALAEVRRGLAESYRNFQNRLKSA